MYLRFESLHLACQIMQLFSLFLIAKGHIFIFNVKYCNIFVQVLSINYPTTFLLITKEPGCKKSRQSNLGQSCSWFYVLTT